VFRSSRASVFSHSHPWFAQPITYSPDAFHRQHL
jgi:hypothetical protein